MFYRPKDGHGLPRNPFTAIVAPRPIGWISTRGSIGANLAPYSFFNAVAYEPPQVMFASTGAKDSLRNLQETGVFCVNIVGEAQFHAMSETSASVAPEVSEFALAGVGIAECQEIDCPRVADAPAALECRVSQVIELEGQNNFLILGQVVGVHLCEDCMTEGRLDARKYRPVARMGYMDYAVIRDLVELARPDER